MLQIEETATMASDVRRAMDEAAARGGLTAWLVFEPAPVGDMSLSDGTRVPLARLVFHHSQKRLTALVLARKGDTGQIAAASCTVERHTPQATTMALHGLVLQPTFSKRVMITYTRGYKSWEEQLQVQGLLVWRAL